MMKVLLAEKILKILEEKIKDSNDALNELQESLKNDSKSSAGDKHETARAMVQMEMEQIVNKGNELVLQKRNFERIGTQQCQLVALGALVKTDLALFYISLALGKIEIDTTEILCIGSNAPIFNSMKGKKINESFEFHEKIYHIQEIT